jgi:hypothetical protein
LDDQDNKLKTQQKNQKTENMLQEARSSRPPSQHSEQPSQSKVYRHSAVGDDIAMILEQVGAANHTVSKPTPRV